VVRDDGRIAGFAMSPWRVSACPKPLLTNLWPTFYTQVETIRFTARARREGKRAAAPNSSSMRTKWSHFNDSVARETKRKVSETMARSKTSELLIDNEAGTHYFERALAPRSTCRKASGGVIISGLCEYELSRLI